MSLYTVTITPDDPALAVTTIRLDVTATAATLHEVRLVPGAAGGLTPGGLPVLDMNQLVTAVSAALGPGSRADNQPMPDPVTGSAEPPETAAKTPGRRQRQPAKPATKTAAKPATKTAAKPATKTASKTASKAAAKAATVSKNARGRVQPKKTSAKKATPSVETGGRSYRRAPEDLDAVLRQAGGRAAIVAEHYGVPRHTAYGWIRGRKKAEAAA